MTLVHIKDLGEARALSRALADAERIALDCEAAGFHRYSDRVCLIQVTVGEVTYLVDPLAFHPGDLLRDPLEDPNLRIVMHGADFDLRLLDRDLEINLGGLFDTQAAAALLGEPGLGLSALLEKYLGVKLSKKHQRADWARRPLPEDMLRYAAADTRHLLALADLLSERLETAGRTAWAEEECRALEEIRWEEDDSDPVTRVRAARDMSERQVAALREALEWRDEIARKRDRAPFRVVGDDVLVEVVLQRPASTHELAGIKGFSEQLARRSGRALIGLLDDVLSRPARTLRGYPTSENGGSGRPAPEVEARFQALRRARNERADELGLDRGSLVPNSTLMEIAEVQPGSMPALRAIPEVKEWQTEAAGDALLAVLNGDS